MRRRRTLPAPCSIVPRRYGLCYVPAHGAVGSTFVAPRSANGARRMSGKWQDVVAAPSRTTGLRSLARAFLLSLCVHAGLVGALWYLISTSLPAPRGPFVEVELAPRATAAS